MAYITSHDTAVADGGRRPGSLKSIEPSFAKGMMIAAPLAFGLWAAIIWSAAQIF